MDERKGITVAGFIAAIETREYEKRDGSKGVQRTVSVLNGRYVDQFDVSSKLNGELDAVLHKDAVLQLRKYTNWRDVTPQIRLPFDSIVVVGVLEPIADAPEQIAA